MNHLWERQSKALGLALVREQINILVGNHLQQQPLIFLKVLLLPPTLRGVFLGCKLRSQQDTAASNPRFPSLEAKTSSFFSLAFPTDPQEELMALCRGSGVSRAALRVTLPL